MGLALLGTLRAPYPDDPVEMGIVMWIQARSAMRESASEIERLTSLVSDFSKQADLDASEISRLIIECNSTPHSEEVNS